eukprot:871099-Pelagomonas_calceolata.AAC.9
MGRKHLVRRERASWQRDMIDAFLQKHLTSLARRIGENEDLIHKSASSGEQGKVSQSHEAFNCLLLHPGLCLLIALRWLSKQVFEPLAVNDRVLRLFWEQEKFSSWARGQEDVGLWKSHAGP